MSATKNYVIKEVGSKTKPDGSMVLAVTVVTPTQVVGGITLLSVEQPVAYEVPTTLDTLVADLKAHAIGYTVPANFGDPVAPAPTASATSAA